MMRTISYGKTKFIQCKEYKTAVMTVQYINFGF